MEWKTYLIYVLSMAGVTYLIRMIPLTAVRGKIKNRFFLSFLSYVPYAVLSSMTFPAILQSTGNAYSATAATAVAVFLGWKGKGLLTVAALSCITAFLVTLILTALSVGIA